MRRRTRSSCSKASSENDEDVSDNSDCSDSDSEGSDDEMKALASNSSVILRDSLGLPKTVDDKQEHKDVFVIDKTPGNSIQIQKSGCKDIVVKVVDNTRKKRPSKKKVPVASQSQLTKKRSYKKEDDVWALSSSLQVHTNMTDVYVNVDTFVKPIHPKMLDNMLLEKSEGQKLMEKSVITPGFEKKHEILPYKTSVNQLKKQRKAERDKSKGKGWFDMKAPEMSEADKNDLTVLHMRRALDPKRFYKAPDLRALPKFYQMGRVVDDPVDFYSSRVPKKERKKTLVDELLADAEFRKFNKRKYAEIVEAKSHGRGAYKHMKRLKKRKR